MKKKGVLKVVIIFLIAMILWIFPLFIWKNFVLSNNIPILDSLYEVLNTLFSGLAFAVLAYTIIQQNKQLNLQKDELELQRKELELNRIELKRTASAQEATEISIKNQAKILEYSAILNGKAALLQTYTKMGTEVNSNYRTKQFNIENEILDLLKEMENKTTF